MTKKDIEKDAPTPPSTGDRTPDQNRFALKKKVRYFYDLQRLRLQCGGRLLPRAPGITIDLHDYDVWFLTKRFDELLRTEKLVLEDIKKHLNTISFYTQVLSDKKRYKGIGPTMAGVILAEFNIQRHDTPSQMWSFSGLKPLPAKRCKECHRVVEEKHPTHEGRPPKKVKCIHAGKGLDDLPTYDSGKAQRPTRGEKLPYNAWLRTKMVGVLADVLIKLKSPWADFYYNYKHRKLSAGWGQSDGHRHQAAKRYMVKMLLLDIWREWRKFEGLPIRPSYQEEYLGHSHHETANARESSMTDERATRPESPSFVERATVEKSFSEVDTQALIDAEIAQVEQES